VTKRAQLPANERLRSEPTEPTCICGHSYSTLTKPGVFGPILWKRKYRYVLYVGHKGQETHTLSSTQYFWVILGTVSIAMLAGLEYEN